LRPQPDVRIVSDDDETITGKLAQGGSDHGLRNVSVHYRKVLDLTAVLENEVLVNLHRIHLESAAGRPILRIAEYKCQGQRRSKYGGGSPRLGGRGWEEPDATIRLCGTRLRLTAVRAAGTPSGPERNTSSHENTDWTMTSRCTPRGVIAQMGSKGGFMSATFVAS